MIVRLRLVRYKGFNDFTVHFGRGVLLIGPNNAGKSTIIGALRLCASAARVASRRHPTERFTTGSSYVHGLALSNVTATGFVAENVRHEFRELESRLELEYASGSKLHIVWPIDGQVPYFYVLDGHGNSKVTPSASREAFASIGIVPTLTPVEFDEGIREAKYIQDKVESRLSSRHFRNHLFHLKTSDRPRFEELRSFLLGHTSELGSLDVATAPRDGGVSVDLLYTDHGSRVEKEIYWAGDGLQIWLQLLFHVWRNLDKPVLLLDEPDVFLHPDLQRRLVRVLEAHPQQTILASHAPEMASEAATGSVTWIERTRKSSKRVAGSRGMSDLAGVLGSGFNLGVAKALSARVALFVEGEDMRLLRALAVKAGFEALAAERHLSIVPMGGFSRWPSVEAFSWLKNEFLGEAVKVMVILDRDYRGDIQIGEIEDKLRQSGIVAHVWRRKELENYLLDAPAIAMLSGATQGEVERLLEEIAEELRDEVEGQVVANALLVAPRGVDPATTTVAALAAMRDAWQDPAGRLAMVPGKLALARLNQLLQAKGYKAAGTRAIAGRVDVASIQEIVAALKEVEAAL